MSTCRVLTVENVVTFTLTKLMKYPAIKHYSIVKYLCAQEKYKVYCFINTSSTGRFI